MVEENLNLVPMVCFTQEVASKSPYTYQFFILGYNKIEKETILDHSIKFESIVEFEFRLLKICYDKI